MCAKKKRYVPEKPTLQNDDSSGSRGARCEGPSTPTSADERQNTMNEELENDPLERKQVQTSICSNAS
jgi:hypothetical protein